MAIKFNCPHCHRALNLKDQLAGKRGACPGCKKVVTIPAATAPASAAAPTPAGEDVESLAASTFFDEPPEAQKEVKLIDFRCPSCDAAIQVSAELQGKQAPCPECRRIIKVPVLAKQDPKDWRKGAAIPSAARRDTEPAPEGAWGSTTSTSNVSRDALEEADAIPQIREKTTLKQWITRGTIAAVVLLTLGGGAWWGVAWWSHRQRDQLVDKALGMVSTDGKNPKLSRDRDAAVLLAAGEYFTRTNKKENTSKARTYFHAARSLLEGAAPPTDPALFADRDALLIELALAQVELGGEGTPVDRGIRLKWEEVQKDLLSTLKTISHAREGEGLSTTAGPRVVGVRAVCRKLVARDQTQAAFTIATNLNSDVGGDPRVLAGDVAETTAAVGLDFLADGRKDLAEKLADAAARHFAPAAAQPGVAAPPAKAVTAPSLIALWLLLDRKSGPQLTLPSASDPLYQVANAETLARQGKRDQALEQAAAIKVPDLQLQAYVAIAGHRQPGSAPEAGDVAPALNFVEDELKKGIKASPWLLVNLAQLAVRAGLAERVQSVAGEVKDPALKGRLQLEVLAARLADSKDKPDEGAADSVEPSSLSHARACELVVRCAARKGDKRNGAVDGWDEGLRPFGYLGVALGMQDAKP